jgi:outer membrane protein
VKKIIFLFAVVVLIASISTAQTIKIAYVNSDKILQELPEYVQIKKELEVTVKVWQDELEKMTKEFQDALDDYQKKEALFDAKAKADKQKNLQDLQQKVRDYQYQKFDQRDGEVVKLREKKFGPIQERVMKIIERVAKAGKYNYVFDKLESATNILYADSKFDITYKVIDELKTK